MANIEVRGSLRGGIASSLDKERSRVVRVTKEQDPVRKWLLKVVKMTWKENRMVCICVSKEWTSNVLFPRGQRSRWLMGGRADQPGDVVVGAARNSKSKSSEVKKEKMKEEMMSSWRK